MLIVYDKLGLIIYNPKNMTKHPKITLGYITRNLSIVIGLVLIWRGIWHILDSFDNYFLGGVHIWTAIGGIIIGLVILYLPDHDLKEIEKL